MNWKEYQARQLALRAEGKEVVPLESVVLQSIKSLGGVSKREDICSVVAARTGMYLVDVMSNLSHTLQKMKKVGLVQSPRNGYWCLSA